MSAFSLQQAQMRAKARDAARAAQVRALDAKAAEAAAGADKGIKVAHVAVGLGLVGLGILIFKRK